MITSKGATSPSSIQTSPLGPAPPLDEEAAPAPGRGPDPLGGMPACTMEGRSSKEGARGSLPPGRSGSSDPRDFFLQTLKVKKQGFFLQTLKAKKKGFFFQTLKAKKQGFYFLQILEN